MRYIFATKMNFFAVCATGSGERMRQNIAASRNPLSAEDVAFLENGETA